ANSRRSMGRIARPPRRKSGVVPVVENVKLGPDADAHLRSAENGKAFPRSPAPWPKNTRPLPARANETRAALPAQPNLRLQARALSPLAPRRESEFRLAKSIPRQ